MYTKDDLMAQTKKNLLHIARETFGLNYLQEVMNKDSIVEEILRAQAQTEDGSQLKAVDEDQALKKGWARVYVEKDPTSKGNYPLVVNGPNDRAYLVPRGVEVDVPRLVFENLKDAWTTNHIFNEEERELVQQTVQSYPFRTIATNF